jgi:signal transduction histidine kinase/DNA-binding response OmpR family regulator
MDLKRAISTIKDRVVHSSLLILAIVSAFALMVFLSSYFMTDIVRNQLAFNAKMELDSLENNIKADLQEPRTVLGNQSECVRTMIMRGSSIEDVHTYLRDITQYILHNESKQLSGFSGIYGFFNIFGGMMLDGQNRITAEHFIPMEHAWYKEAVAAGGKIIFLDPHSSKASDVVFTYARSIFDDTGNLLGVIAMDMKFDRIRQYIISENIGKMWWGILLNEEHRFLFHIRSSLEGTRFADMNSDTAQATAELELKHEVSEFKMRNYQDIHSITFIRKMENGWYVGIVTPEDRYFAEVKKVRVILIILGIVLSIIFCAIMIRIVMRKEEADAKRQMVDAKLQEAETLLENVNIMHKILNSLDAMIYITNPQSGEIIFINDNLKEYHGITNDCIGRTCYEVFQEGLDRRCDFCPCNQLDLDQQQTVEWIEYSKVTKRNYRNTSCYITWPGGSIVHLRYSVDVTDLFAAKEEAIAASRVKSDFLAKMSHEIRSPMNAILGIIEIELEKDLPPDTEEALDKVHNSGYMLLNIINDILDLSKIESGKMELLPVEYDVASVINDTVQLNLMRFGSKPIKFFLKVEENVPARLFGDDLRIKQVLNNLLSNSFKYTKDGEIKMSVWAEVSGTDNADKSVKLSFRISDTGLGMTKEQVSGLFDSYARFNSEANRQVEGTGLGMSITKNFIDMMKGEILVESEPGKGSTFTLHIPQGYINADVLGKEGADNLQKFDIEKKAKQKKGSQIQREYMPYGKVLVVDDMEPNLYVAKGLLAPYGLSIDTASSGQAAIDIIKGGQKFDVIFMDHYMPEMDGMEATKIIRELGYKEPMIALTANALVGQDKMYLENGFDGFMSKPIDTRQLNSTLNRFIRDKYPPETVEAARKLKNKLEKGEDAGPPDFSKVKALVVDDFLPNLSVAQGMLQEYKMQVDGLSSGQEAVERIEAGEPKYDIVFMDLMMPEMDGMEATRLIRSLSTEYGKKVPIVALTAIITSETSNQEKMLLEKGFQAVLYKPLSVAKVDAFLKDWINGKLEGIISPNKKGIMSPNEKEEGKDMEVTELDIPGVNAARVEELYGGNMKIYLPVLRSYLSVIPGELEKMSHVTQETLPDYVVKVHGVKSTSDSIGAERAHDMALELEMAGKAGDLATVTAKNEDLIKYVKNLLVYIKEWLSKIDAQ